MNLIRTPALAAVAAAMMLSACTTLPPNGPSVMALPGTGKSFDQFRIDDQDCRQYGFQQTGISPNNAAVDSGVRSAAIGTLLGAAAGAAFNGGRGAAVGAGAGLLLGSSAGAGAANESSYGIQRRYDAAYVQCMYSRGHRVPVSGRMMSGDGADGGYAPPSSQGVPPPPAGMPPPPPPPRGY